MTNIIPLIPTIIFVILCVVPLSTLIFIFKRQSRCHNTLLNMDFHKAPGHNMGLRLEEITVDILTKALFIPLVPITIYSIYAIQVALTAKDIAPTIFYVYLAGAAAFILSLSRDVFLRIKERTALQVAYEYALAVGQELSSLSAAGVHIYHDFPTPNHHINHLAIGPQGVFAITTIGRIQNQTKGEGKGKLHFDNSTLHFPGWTETEPLTKAREQAVWLTEWLENATGIRIIVTPVLAVPGWRIDTGTAGDVKIFNGTNPAFLSKGPSVLNEKQLKALTVQIARQNRDDKIKPWAQGSEAGL